MQLLLRPEAHLRERTHWNEQLADRDFERLGQRGERLGPRLALTAFDVPVSDPGELGPVSKLDLTQTLRGPDPPEIDGERRIGRRRHRCTS